MADRQGGHTADVEIVWARKKALPRPHSMKITWPTGREGIPLMVNDMADHREGIPQTQEFDAGRHTANDINEEARLKSRAYH